MLCQKCFSGAFETKCSVKSSFKVRLGENISFNRDFKVLFRRNPRSKVLFRCFRDEIFSQKCFYSAFKTKCSVKSAFLVLLRRNSQLKGVSKVHLRRNTRSKVILKCFLDEMFCHACFSSFFEQNF